jgi:hypothetical protein
MLYYSSNFILYIYNIYIYVAQNIVKEIKQWLQHVQRMDTGYQTKLCNTDRKEEETLGDRGRDGGTNLIWRIKKHTNTPKLSRT